MIRMVRLVALILLSHFSFGQNSQITAIVEPYATSNNFSGTVLVTKDGKVIYEQSFGFASRELNIPASSSTVYHLASVSKPFTSTAILQLEEAGKLKLTDPVSTWFPDFPGGDRITVHHLLCHTSGIANINSFPNYDELSLHANSLDTLIRIIAKQPLRFDPGARYEYSNSNYNLLAKIIEKTSGLSFGDYLSKNIFERIGMKSTRHHGNPAEIIPQLAPGYSPVGRNGLERAPWLDWSIKTGNGSLVSTVSDLSLFDQALNGDKLLRPSSRGKMFTPNLDETGYGWFLRADEGTPRTYINGRSPGFSAYVGRYPSEKLCVIVLSNIYVPVATEIGVQIAHVILGKKVMTHSLTDKIVTQGERYSGVYQFGPDYYRPNAKIEVKMDQGRLTSTFGDLIENGESKFMLRSFWSEVIFEIKNGHVEGLTMDGFKAVRTK